MRILAVFFMVLFLSVPARADKWYVVTAYDTDNLESGYSNKVQYIGKFPLSIAFAWEPNTEPNIKGYKLRVSSVKNDPYIVIDIVILHSDACTIQECQQSILLELITEIQLKGGLP